MQDIAYRSRMHGISFGEMDHSSVKKYTIPRKARRVSADCQSQISLNSREAKELENNIKRLMWKGSELDNIFSIDQIYKVDNPTLERKFQEKRSELREDGRSQRELTEHLAFLIETAYHKVKDVCVNGMKCNGDDSLGDGQMGVSLWKSPDLLLKNLECPELGIVYLIVFRMVKGRVKQVVTKPYPQAPNLEPTPNYDCHMSRTAPSPSMSDHQTLLKSTQYYLYEYDDEGLPCERPRLCLPSAVIHLRKKNTKKLTDEHAQSQENISSPCPQVTDNNAIPFLTEGCGNCAWRGLVTNKEKGLGWVTMMSGHKLGLNLWKSYLDVTKKISLVELEKTVPGDIRSAWTTPLPYRDCVFSLCLLKATVPYTESFTRFTKNMSEKAKAAGVICVDATTTLFLLPSSNLSQRLGIFQNGEPWRMCCIVCRHKNTAGTTVSMAACRPASLLLPTATAKKKAHAPTSQFAEHVLDTTVRHRAHIQLPQFTGGLARKPQSVVKRSHSDSDCRHPISNRSPEYQPSQSQTEQSDVVSGMTEFQEPHWDPKPQDKNDADKRDVDAPESKHSINSEVATDLISTTEVNAVTHLKSKKKRSCSADLSPQSVKKYIRHAKTLRRCYSKRLSGATSKEECPEKCDTLQPHPAQNQQVRSTPHSYDTTDFDLTTTSERKDEVIYVDSSSDTEDKTQSPFPSKSTLQQRADFITADRNEYKMSNITCRDAVSESKTLTASTESELVVNDNYCLNSKSTENMLKSNTTASQGTAPAVTSPIMVLKGTSELPLLGHEKIKPEQITKKLHCSDPEKNCVRSPKRQSLRDSLSDLGNGKNSAATLESEDVKEEELTKSNSTILFPNVATPTETLTEPESLALRIQPIDSSLDASSCFSSSGKCELNSNVLELGNTVQFYKKSDFVDVDVAATVLQSTEDQGTESNSKCCKMPVVVEKRDCLEHNGDTLASLENDSSTLLSKLRGTTNTIFDVPDMIETVVSTEFPLSPTFEKKPCLVSLKQNSKRPVEHCAININCDSIQVSPQSKGIEDEMPLIGTSDTVNTFKRDEVTTSMVNKESHLPLCHHNPGFRSSDSNTLRKNDANLSNPRTSYCNSPDASNKKAVVSCIDCPNIYDCSKSNYIIYDEGSSFTKSRTAEVGSLNSTLSKPDTSRQSYARAFQRVFVPLKSPRKRRHSDTELTSITAEYSTREVKRRFSLDKRGVEKDQCKMSKENLSLSFLDFTSRDSTMKECEISSPVSSPIISSSDLTPKSLEKYVRHKKKLRCSRRQLFVDGDTRAEKCTAGESFPLSNESETTEIDTQTNITNSTLLSKQCCENDTALTANAAVKDSADAFETPDNKKRHGLQSPSSTKADVATNNIGQLEIRYDDIEDNESDAELERFFRLHKANVAGERQKADKELCCEPVREDREASSVLYSETVISERRRRTSPCSTSSSNCEKSNFESDSTNTAIKDKTVETMQENLRGEEETAPKTVNLLTHRVENEEVKISPRPIFECTIDTRCLESVLDVPYLKTSTAENSSVSNATRNFEYRASEETAEPECMDYPCVSDICSIEVTEDQNVNGEIPTPQGENLDTGTTNNFELKTNVEVAGRITIPQKFSVAQCNDSITGNSESKEVVQELNREAWVPDRTAVELKDKLVEADCSSTILDTEILEQENSIAQRPPVSQLKSIVSASTITTCNAKATDSKPSNLQHFTIPSTTNNTYGENGSQSEEVLGSITPDQCCIVQVQDCDMQDHVTTKPDKLIENAEELKKQINQGQKENDNRLNLKETPSAESNNSKHPNLVSVPHNTKRQQKEDRQANVPRPHGVASNGLSNLATRGPLLPSQSPANPLPRRWSPPVNYPCNYPSTVEPQGRYTNDRFMCVPTLRPAATASFGWSIYRAPPVWNTDWGYCFNGNFDRQVHPNVTSVSWSVPRLPFPVHTFPCGNNSNLKFSQRRS